MGELVATGHPAGYPARKIVMGLWSMRPGCLRWRPVAGQFVQPPSVFAMIELPVPGHSPIGAIRRASGLRLAVSAWRGISIRTRVFAGSRAGEGARAVPGTCGYGQEVAGAPRRPGDRAGHLGGAAGQGTGARGGPALRHQVCPRRRGRARCASPTGLPEHCDLGWGWGRVGLAGLAPVRSG